MKSQNILLPLLVLYVVFLFFIRVDPPSHSILPILCTYKLSLVYIGPITSDIGTSAKSCVGPFLVTTSETVSQED